jgi:hypothetical protein
MDAADEHRVARLPQELFSSWRTGHTVDQVQGHEHRRQRCAAAVGPARGAARSLRSQARQRSIQTTGPIAIRGS